MLHNCDQETVIGDSDALAETAIFRNASSYVVRCLNCKYVLVLVACTEISKRRGSSPEGAAPGLWVHISDMGGNVKHR